MGRRMRRWAKHWQMAGSLRRLANKHEKCCKAGAEWAVNNYSWDSSEFGSYGLEQAYRESDRLGCTLHGWHKRLIIEYWAARLTHWSF